MLGGRYHILSMLGRGGMGVVYLAEDARLERKVAVKVIDPAVASEELEARLESEARLLGRLSHPGIVPIYDLGRQDEITLFYVMKHVEGETLEQWLPAHPSRAERLRLFQKLCDPVSFAHAQGIAHRDLKPANVMIGAFGEVLIMDWGLAVPIGEPPDDDAVGTPGYRDRTSTAEYASVEPLIAADVFSLGAILYFLLTGEHPPQGRRSPAAALSWIRPSTPDSTPSAPAPPIRSAPSAMLRPASWRRTSCVTSTARPFTPTTSAGTSRRPAGSAATNCGCRSF